MIIKGGKLISSVWIIFLFLVLWVLVGVGTIMIYDLLFGLEKFLRYGVLGRIIWNNILSCTEKYFINGR